MCIENKRQFKSMWPLQSTNCLDFFRQETFSIINYDTAIHFYQKVKIDGKVSLNCECGSLLELYFDCHNGWLISAYSIKEVKSCNCSNLETDHIWNNTSNLLAQHTITDAQPNPLRISV